MTQTSRLRREYERGENEDQARFDLLKITFIAFYFVFSKNSFPSKAPFYLFFFFTRKVKIVIFDIFIEEGWLNPFSIAK